jgi:hypothetical protein
VLVEVYPRSKTVTVLFDVFLDNVGPLLSVDIGVRYNLLNLREFPADLNATASIGVFSRLDYPNLLP